MKTELGPTVQGWGPPLSQEELCTRRKEEWVEARMELTPTPTRSQTGT
jgi:hypothetical protein